MALEIMHSFSSLQSELEQAKSGLKTVDENIKRLIGRDPSEVPIKGATKRSQNDQRSTNNDSNGFIWESNEPPSKRRSNTTKRYYTERNPYVHNSNEESPHKQQMFSKVIVTTKELPSRQDVLASRRTDEQSKARNRRMFGALLNTLQKFQVEEVKMKQKEEMRAQVEKKIEEHELKEREDIRKERQELFLNRRKKQAEIKMIELKMIRMKEYTVWEEMMKHRTQYLQTKTQPFIHYLPKKLREIQHKLLDSNKVEVEDLISKRRQEVQDELQSIEERMRKGFIIKRKDDVMDESLEQILESSQNIEDDSRCTSQICIKNEEETRLDVTTNNYDSIKEDTSRIVEMENDVNGELDLQSSTVLTDNIIDELSNVK